VAQARAAAADTEVDDGAAEMTFAFAEGRGPAKLRPNTRPNDSNVLCCIPMGRFSGEDANPLSFHSHRVAGTQLGLRARTAVRYGPTANRVALLMAYTVPSEPMRVGV
jgi:hypothetical protein